MFIFTGLSLVDGSAVGYRRLAGDGRLLTVKLERPLEGPNRVCSSQVRLLLREEHASVPTSTQATEQRFCLGESRGIG